ncbi:MAG: hypothetical protein ACD_45C00740G0002 [uncultured bacterium]|nr:MAG: hypothetical protein ACD_45C00740G0002 [uncultured bacterium]
MMIKKIISYVLVSLLGFALNFFSISVFGRTVDSSVFQVATINALAQGVYDGDYTYGKLMKHGDFGLGTFLGINGEMVAVDGHFYQIESDGTLKLVTANQITPFAEVTHFKPSLHHTLNNLANYQDLGKHISAGFPNKNIPYAIRIDGTFKALKLRSFRKQKEPYPLLAQASENQAIFHLQNVTGSLVGFWFPEYWEGIAVAGFHFHFITKDHTMGGHVLEVNLGNGELAMEPLYQVQVYLPNTRSFAKANLSAEELDESVKKAEGGT